MNQRRECVAAGILISSELSRISAQIKADIAAPQKYSARKLYLICSTESNVIDIFILWTIKYNTLCRILELLAYLPR